MITATMTTKSSRAEGRNRSLKIWKSNIFHAITSRIPARAAIGTQAISGRSAKKAISTSTPSIAPLHKVRPPLVTFTSVGPIVAEPDIPPASDDAALATPCAISSRFES